MRKILKRLTCMALGVLLALTATACSNKDNVIPPVAADNSRPQTETAKTLVVYFSQPDNVDNSTVVIDGETLGNTQYMAYVIQENTGANIFRVVPSTPYPANHSELVDHAREEQSKKARPTFVGEIENFADYDTVFVGYPNWWSDMPMIMYTLFDTYDFSGKTIIPFNTHGGSGFSSTVSTIKGLEPDATVRDGMSVSRDRIQDAEQQIIDWVKSMGFDKPAETPVNTDSESTVDGSNILVVYFSYSSNTERIAEYIADKLNADIVQIEAAVPYTAQDVNYSIPDMRPEVERDTNARPEIAQTTYDKIDMSRYETVFIGYPIWWWTAPMIIGTFLEHYDLSGKNIYPFSQSASMNATQFDNSVEFVRECSTRNGTPVVHDGLFTKTNDDIDEYLSSIALPADLNHTAPH